MNDGFLFKAVVSGSTLVAIAIVVAGLISLALEE
jgi:hypothetical protein